MNSNTSISKTELIERQSWTLDQKICHSLEVIDVFYNRMEGNVYLAFSGGKDSTVLKWLIETFLSAASLDPIPNIFNNTTNEYKDILEFVRSFGDKVIWLRPEMTFAQSLVKNGYPLVSKEQAQYIYEARTTKSLKLYNIRMYGKKKTAKSGRQYLQGKISEKWKYLVHADIKITSKCCEILKKRPVKKYEKETGRRAIIGTMAENSSLRMQTYLKNGCNTFEGRPVSRPLSIWTETDIWACIKKYDIEYAKIYDDQVIDGVKVAGEENTGCAYCAFGQHLLNGETKFDRLKIREPKRYASFMDKLGYRKAIEAIGIKLPEEIS